VAVNVTAHLYLMLRLGIHRGLEGQLCFQFIIRSFWNWVTVESDVHWSLIRMLFRMTGIVDRIFQRRRFEETWTALRS
jgi:hypothetical protein